MQGLRTVGGGTVGPVIQAGRATGNETADLRAEELEQRHMPAACSGSQAQGLHCSHLQPNAAHRHVDGSSADAQKFWPKGQHCFKIKLTVREVLVDGDRAYNKSVITSSIIHISGAYL